MSDQNPMKAIEQAIYALWSIDLDQVKDAIRAELMAEVRDEIRQELIDEIRDELESAVNDAEDESAPEIGTENAWGQDDAVVLRAFLTTFDQTW
jgi:hypothetical protein